ncbi:PP2C family protein-serine/threonine phosphatase [Mycobacterium bourgelatii]|uniref:Serine/threonine protein phosphatase PstP n=1 Tax=Mycobacterium bourgelatii TaxID=1273442 RepID=A0A7I9YY68_MYCBU|nr:protein phosphatase 2C domain-containing protein [Mycobacterium bourgelatii]MCV6977400.1 serine/threonine-protein phosphatase [Mycobacterium bourgelatii]GFG93674.1 PP2C-family Ser/Thr phosphatase [Mycobacterium bourgelatii]
MTLVLRYAARSDRGLVRANNEDSVYAGGRLLALADGMGGHAAGEVASQLVIAALAPLDYDDPGGDLLGKLEAAVRAGNSAIAAQVEQEPDLEGMGTTLTAILFAGTQLGLAHIGDSRGYLFRDGELTQITKDDTFVQTLVDEGRITAEEAHSHPQRSLIMRALTGHEVEPTLTIREARVGDRYLLCSDGLSDPVSNETIAEALQIPDVAESAYRLIELALRGGGPDNVTVVVADVVDDEYGQTQPILAGAVSGDEEELTLPNTAAGRASAISPRKESPKRAPPAEVETIGRSHWSRRRIALVSTLVVLAILVGLFIAQLVIQSNYYVAERNGKVAVIQGIQGLPLQKAVLVGCLNDQNQFSDVPFDQLGDHPECRPLTPNDLRGSDREQLRNGIPAADLEAAKNTLRELANKALPLCPGHATAPPDQAPSTHSRGTPEPTQTLPPLTGATTTEPPPATTTPNTAPTTTPTAPGATTTPPTGTTEESPSETTAPSVSTEVAPTTVPPQPGIDCRAAA